MKKIIIFLIIFAQLAAFCACAKKEEVAVRIIEYKDMSTSLKMNWFGRNYSDEKIGAFMFNYSAAGFEVNFEGTALTAEIYGAQTGYGNTFISVFCDGKENVLEILLGKNTYKLCENLTEGTHTVKVLKRTELQFTSAGLVKLETDGLFLGAPQRKSLKIEFYGDSITCGYGNISEIGEGGFKTSTENALKTYAYLTADYFNADSNLICYSGWYISKSLYATEESKISDVYDVYSKDNLDKWDFNSYVADIVVVNIGANDENYINISASEGLTKAQKLQYYYDEYYKFVINLRAAYKDAYIILVTGMLGESTVPNTILSLADDLYENGDKKVFASTLYARDIPTEVGADGHPSAAAHEKSAKELIDIIEDIRGNVKV